MREAGISESVENKKCTMQPRNSKGREGKETVKGVEGSKAQKGGEGDEGGIGDNGWLG